MSVSRVTKILSFVHMFAVETVNRLTDLLSERNLHFATYDLTDLMEVSDFFLMITDIFGRLQIKNIVLLANITAVEKLFIQVRKTLFIFL